MRASATLFDPSRFRRLALLVPIVVILALTFSTFGRGASASAVDAPGSISGTVTNSSGAPVAGVNVSALGSGPIDQQGSAVSGVDGTYSIANLPAATYRVSFSPSEASGYAMQWWQHANTQATQTPLVVSSGAALTGINATLLVGATISGTVRDAVTGAPVGGIPIGIFDIAQQYEFELNPDANGNYRAVGLAAGHYEIIFRGSEDGIHQDQFYKNSPTLAGATALDVTFGQNLTGIDSDLVAASTGTGGSTDTGSISGTVRSRATGLPLPVLAVTVFAAGGQAVSSVGTDTQGNYTITELPAGTYQLRVQDLSIGYITQWYQNAATQATATALPLAANQQLTGIDVNLDAVTPPVVTPPVVIPPVVIPPVVPPGAASIAGTVTDRSTGLPIAHASVSAYAADGTVAATASTDSEGDYTVAGLAVGTYKVQFQPGAGENFLPQWWDNKATQSSAKPIVLKANQHRTGIDADLAPAAVDSRTPKIVGAAKVGTTLTVNTGTWSPSTVTFSYQWQQDGVDVPGATAPTYTLTNGDTEHTIDVVVTGSKPGYTSDFEASKPTREVTGGILSTSVPTITGTPARGETLTANAGVWGPGTVTLSYQWYRNGHAISGADDPTYLLTRSEVGTAITVKVTGSEDDFITRSLESAATASVGVGARQPTR